MLTSREVAWWPVHLFMESVLAQSNCGPIPPAGTSAWHELADGDPRKLLALAAAGEHHVLRIEIAQEAMAAAGRDIAAAVDCAAMAARIIGGRGPAFVPRIKEAS